MTTVAIIGAGISGVTLARTLAANHDVVVFEKGRGVGGRMASRYSGQFLFDHGAQYFTQRDTRFADLLKPLIASGTVVPWAGPIANIAHSEVTEIREPRDIHYVGAPNMDNVVKALAHGLDLRARVDIAPLTLRSSGGWLLNDANGTNHGVFDWVIFSTTAHQTMTLLADNAPSSGALTTATMTPCYALMLGFEGRLDLPWVAARVSASPIEWVGVNSIKSGRDNSRTTLVVHSTSDWAKQHLGRDVKELGSMLGDAFRDVTGINPQSAAFSATHRWTSARRLPQTNSRPYLNVERHLAATGDWTTGSRVEDTVLSALNLAAQIGRTIGDHQDRDVGG